MVRCSLIIFGLVIVALLCAPLLLLTPEHDMHCPFALGNATICSFDTLEHLHHFQIAFAAILLTLLTFVLVAVWTTVHAGLSPPSRERIRVRARISRRPTLFQELFSSGIINRKEPQCLVW